MEDDASSSSPSLSPWSERSDRSWLSGYSSPVSSPSPLLDRKARPEWAYACDPDSPLPFQTFFEANQSFRASHQPRRFFYAQSRKRLHPLALILPAFVGGALLAWVLTRAGSVSADALARPLPGPQDVVSRASPSENGSRYPTRTFGRGPNDDWHGEIHRRIVGGEGTLEEYRRRCMRIARAKSAEPSLTVFEDADGDDLPADSDVDASLPANEELELAHCRELLHQLQNRARSLEEAPSAKLARAGIDLAAHRARKRRLLPATEDERSVEDILAYYGYKPAAPSPPADNALALQKTAAPTHILDNAPSEPGDYITTLFEQGGPGTRIFLQPRTVWNLETPILLTHDDQELATLSYPEDDADKAILQTVGKPANAVNMGGLKRTRLRSLVIDGQELKFGRTEPASALVFVAGPDSEDQLVEDCVLRHPRGWSCCHVYEHGLRTRIVNNRMGPAGRPPPRGPLVNVKGPWSDCISNAGLQSFVAGNDLTDCTDGGIVVFGAMGSVVVNNTIRARHRDLLGAINLVDYHPYAGNYTGTRILHNRIISDGAYIRLGIGVGSRPWEDGQGIGAFGATIKHNIVGPGTFGYAIAVGGASDMTVTDNRVHPRAIFEGQAPPQNPAAQPFVKFVSPEEPGGDLQEGFTQGFFRNLIGIQSGPASSERHYASGFSLRPGSFIELRSARLELRNHGVLVMRELFGEKRVLWTSPNALNSTDYPVARLTPQGVLEIRDASDQLLWASRTSPNPQASPGQLNLTASVIFSEMAPHVMVMSETGDVVWSSPMSHFAVGWQLFSGQFISLSDTVPAWLTLDPQTSQLVLHTSPEPLQIKPELVVWHSPHQPWKWDGKVEHRSVATLQDDSNLVINAFVRGKSYPLWASNTHDGEELRYVALHGPNEPGGMRLDLLAADMKPRWSSSSGSHSIS